jgi:hypothetical protein
MKNMAEENANTFNYRMLGRLKSDCDYYLGNGGESPNCLWAKDEKEQIRKMKELHNAFPDGEKPEWLTMAEIEEYERKMVVAKQVE